LLLVVLLLLSGAWILSLRRKALRQAAELATIKGKLAERSVALVQTEQRAQKLQKAVSKQSAAILQAAHELRSPAASIYNTLDVLLQGYSGGAPSKQVEMLCLVRDRAGAMLGMLNDCLSLGAIQSTKAEKQVLPLQVEDVLSRVASGMRIKATLKGIDLTLEVPDALPPVGAVEEHIAQLLSNLLDNAIKYTDRGGKVTAILREDCGYVVGTVEDTGIGIPPQDMSRIFEEFFRAENAKRAEPYGSGLGLPLVKRVVELYGGQLQVESELGVGTKFTFILPAFKATGQAEAGASTILAVE
jgi:signal transduction histidine kinase